MNLLKKLTVTALAVAIVAGLAVSAHAQKKDPSWPDKLRMGVAPTEGAADTAERFKGLAEHLTKELGIPVEVISASDYAGIITAMAAKNIELAYFGPKSYTEAAEKANAQAVALEKGKDGQPGYYGVVIAKSGSGMKTIQDAKGKTFAFTDPNSTSGYLVPNILFYRDLKTKPEEFFKEVKFSGSHGASILSVKNGSIDTAATNNVDLDRAATKGDARWEDFVILWKSELIPGSPMVVRGDLPESLKKAYGAALLKFNDNKDGLVKLQIGGYEPATDQTYDVTRYMNRLKDQLTKKQ